MSESLTAIDPACDLTAFTDEECSRYALGGVFWDHVNGCFVATDSWILAIVEAPDRHDGEAQEADRSFVMPRVLMRRGALARTKEDGRSGELHAELSRDGAVAVVRRSVGDESLEMHAPLVTGRFPKYTDCLPAEEKFHPPVYLDSKYLGKIAEYCARFSNPDNGGITVRMPKEDGTPVEFGFEVDEGRYAWFVIMPLAADRRGAVPSVSSRVRREPIDVRPTES